MENKDNKINIKPIKRIAGTLATGVLLAITLIGTGFGLANSVEETKGNVDTRYNETVQIQTKVKIKESGKTINDAADSIYKTMAFLGEQNAEVKTIGNDTIVVTDPVSSFVDSEKTLIEMMKNTENNKNYIKEVQNLIVPLFTDGTLDFRTVKGNEIFSSAGYGFEFMKSNLEEDNSKSDETETKSNREYDDLNDPYDFFTTASVVHSNGAPLIKVGISKKSGNSDQYLNLFKDFNTWISTNKNNESFTTDYVVWFNFKNTYEQLSNLSDEVSNPEDVWTYVSGSETLRPLYLTASNIELMSNKYENSIQLTGNFTDSQANYFVDKINNSNSFEYSNLKVVMLSNDQTKVFLTVIASLLITFIIVVIFAFVGYFGLLGVLASISFLLINLIVAIVTSASGIAISGIVLLALFIVSGIAATCIYIVFNRYKNGNEDKFVTITNRFFTKVKDINKLLLVPTISIIITLYISSIVMPIALSAVIYLILIGLLFTFLVSVMVTLPLIYVFDLLLEFTPNVQTNKWTWTVGTNQKKNTNINTDIKNIKKRTLTVSLSGVIVLLVSLIIGVSLYSLTGSSTNNNIYGREDYVYNVAVINDQLKVDSTSEDPDEDGSWSWANISEKYYKDANALKGNIKKDFKSNGIDVTNISVVNNDEILNIDNDSFLTSFGFIISSRNAISQSQALKINESLSTEVISIDDGSGNKSGFMLEKAFSWNGKESKKVNSYSKFKYTNLGILSVVLIILITVIITLFIAGWGVSISVALTTTLETIFIISPIYIFFIPYNLLVWLPIMLFLAVSATIKIQIAQEAKEDEVKSERWARSTKKKMLLIPLMAMFLLPIELFLIGAYSFIIMVPIIVITIIAPLVIFSVQQFFFPYMSLILGDYRDGTKKNQLKADIRKSKDKENKEPKEEYIEGVNM